MTRQEELKLREEYFSFIKGRETHHEIIFRWIVFKLKQNQPTGLSQVACASGGVDTVAERGVKYCEWCQLETPIKDNKCSECGKPCAEVL